MFALAPILSRGNVVKPRSLLVVFLSLCLEIELESRTIGRTGGLARRRPAHRMRRHTVRGDILCLRVGSELRGLESVKPWVMVCRELSPSKGGMQRVKVHERWCAEGMIPRWMMCRGDESTVDGGWKREVPEKRCIEGKSPRKVVYKGEKSTESCVVVSNRRVEYVGVMKKERTNARPHNILSTDSKLNIFTSQAEVRPKQEILSAYGPMR